MSRADQIAHLDGDNMKNDTTHFVAKRHRAVITIILLSFFSFCQAETAHSNSTKYHPNHQDTVDKSDVSQSDLPPESEAEKRLRREKRNAEFNAWNTARFKEIERQKFWLSCGAASLATLLKYDYGLSTSEAVLLQNIHRDGDEKLLSMNDIVQMAQSVGVSMKGFRVSLTDLQKLTRPVIIQLKEPLTEDEDHVSDNVPEASDQDQASSAHFVIVQNVDSLFVHVKDPAFGNKRIGIWSFAKSWFGAKADHTSAKGVVLAITGKID
jgi:predicted double-glycine peptidase